MPYCHRGTLFKEPELLSPISLQSCLGGRILFDQTDPGAWGRGSLHCTRGRLKHLECWGKKQGDIFLTAFQELSFLLSLDCSMKRGDNFVDIMLALKLQDWHCNYHMKIIVRRKDCAFMCNYFRRKWIWIIATNHHQIRSNLLVKIYKTFSCTSWSRQLACWPDKIIVKLKL